MRPSELREAYEAGALGKQAYIEAMHDLHRALFAYADLLRDTDIASICVSEAGVAMTTKKSGITLLCDFDDTRTIPVEILNFRRYEDTELRLIEKLVRPDGVVLDVGANIGWYAIHLGKTFPRATIHAFEPIPRTFAQLRRHLEINQVRNVQAHEVALFDEVGEKDFFFYPKCSGNASAADLTGLSTVHPIRCPVTTVDAFCKRTGTRPDFVKCDVEGAELFVFRGALQTIAESRPVIFTEMLRKWSAKFDYHPNAILELLAELGYRCFTARDDRFAEIATIDDSTVETNFFLLHRDAHTHLILALAD